MADVQSLVRRGRALRERLAAARLEPYSRLYLVGERADWVTHREMLEIGRVARALGVDVGDARGAEGVRGQSVFYGSQFDFFARDPLPLANRVGLAYYHGLPGTPGYPEFDLCFDGLRRHRDDIDRVQVTHSQLRDVVLSSGIDPARVLTIPIGIALRDFPLGDAEAKRRVRDRYGIPQSAVVVGSFQKDGVGWGEGDEPKTIKGPDVFVDVVARLRERVPELHVLLTGPARGFVKRRLEALGVPYAHVVAGGDGGSLAEIGELFHALDLYVIASRQEGGPKALFEAWATGVPLVTTRVGQAMDMVEHGANGWLVDVEDVDGLVHWAAHALERPGDAQAAVERARRDVERHDYAAQAPLWRELLSGFVQLPRDALPPRP